jgi:hypothetical protein
MLSCNLTMFGCWSFRQTRASRSNFWKSRAVNFFVLIIFAANSSPVDFCTHRFTMEKAPLWEKKKYFQINFPFRYSPHKKLKSFTSLAFVHDKNLLLIHFLYRHRKVIVIKVNFLLTFQAPPSDRNCRRSVCRRALPFYVYLA